MFSLLQSRNNTLVWHTVIWWIRGKWTFAFNSLILCVSPSLCIRCVLTRLKVMGYELEIETLFSADKMLAH